MKYDSLAQGGGCILLACAMASGLYLMVIVNSESDFLETSCTVLKPFVFKEQVKLTNNKGENNLENPYIYAAEISFSRQEEDQNGIMYGFSCEHISRENCEESLGTVLRRGTHVICFYDPQSSAILDSSGNGGVTYEVYSSEEVAYERTGKSKTTSRSSAIWFLVLCCFTCLPCCFIAGVVLILVGISPKNRFENILGENLRCDNTTGFGGVGMENNFAPINSTTSNNSSSYHEYSERDKLV